MTQQVSLTLKKHGPAIFLFKEKASVPAGAVRLSWPEAVKKIEEHYKDAPTAIREAAAKAVIRFHNKLEHAARPLKPVVAKKEPPQSPSPTPAGKAAAAADKDKGDFPGKGERA